MLADTFYIASPQSVGIGIRGASVCFYGNLYMFVQPFLTSGWSVHEVCPWGYDCFHSLDRFWTFGRDLNFLVLSQTAVGDRSKIEIS